MKPTFQKAQFVSLYHDTRRVKSNGKFPLKLRVYSNSPKTQKLFATPFEFTKEEFKNAWESPRTKKEYRALRIKLQEYETRANRLAEQISPFTFEEFERQFKRKPGDRERIVHHFDSAIEEKIKAGSISTSSTYRLSLRSIDRFQLANGGKDIERITFSDITPKWLRSYESYMTQTEMRSTTTVSIYLRALKAVFNRAIDLKDIDREIYPFGKRKYSVPTVRKKKRALRKDQLKQLIAAEPANHLERKARAFWMFSLVCNGMNMKDIAELKWRDFRDDRFEFQRAKTSTSGRGHRQTIQVFLNATSREVIQEYGNPSRDSEDFVFDILNRGLTPAKRHQKVKGFTRFVNQHLKKLSAREGLPSDISTYWARHTFATLGIQQGASMEFMQESLGHSNIKTTQIYFGGFDDEARRSFSENLLTLD
ncbi:MAG: tyrosine-type recombinase/integrase [Flavobacteriales bacterium]